MMNQNNISLKKVIKGLECISGGAKQLCRDCEYSKREEWCIEECAKDALALLKAQEPRVMTLEEYNAWTDIPFTERDPVFREERTERGTVTCWVNTTVCSLREYGQNNRCWTSRPTEEQRRAEPWER